MQPETVLRVLRRLKYGRLKDAAVTLGFSVWTLRRAELGGAVGAETRRSFEEAFDLPWRTLMRPFVDQIVEEAP